MAIIICTKTIQTAYQPNGTLTGGNCLCEKNEGSEDRSGKKPEEKNACTYEHVKKIGSGVQDGWARRCEEVSYNPQGKSRKPKKKKERKIHAGKNLPRGKTTTSEYTMTEETRKPPAKKKTPADLRKNEKDQVQERNCKAPTVKSQGMKHLVYMAQPLVASVKGVHTKRANQQRPTK